MKYGKKERDDFDFKILRNSNERLPAIRIVSTRELYRLRNFL